MILDNLIQRARELLAAEYERDGEVTVPEQIRHDELAELTGFQRRGIRAIMAALAQQGAVVLDPQLAKFYDVDSVAALLAAQEEHILKLQDTVRRNVKPWEDTFPPTLLPKYLRDSGLEPIGQQAVDEKLQEAIRNSAMDMEAAARQEEPMLRLQRVVLLTRAEELRKALTAALTSHGKGS